MAGNVVGRHFKGEGKTAFEGLMTHKEYEDDISGWDREPRFNEEIQDAAEALKRMREKIFSEVR